MRPSGAASECGRCASFAGSGASRSKVQSIGIPLDLRKAIEAEGMQKHKLPADFIVMNASHTHCGPELRVHKLPPGASATALRPAREVTRGRA